jgi:Fe-S-cluster containining protein
MIKKIKRSKIIPEGKKSTKMITLKEKLNRIYYTSINLDSTCKCSNLCCNTAMPSMNYCEFSLLLTEIWQKYTKEQKLELLFKSIEYFFKNEFNKFGKEIFLKPCMFLKDSKCQWYSLRSLNCRMYGLWPEDQYNARVDKFEKAYSGLLKREELPLNKQCPNVKRIDETVPITKEVIDVLFAQLDALDKKMGRFTQAQIDNKENYRTFHDWLLWLFLGEDSLVVLTRFMMGAKKEIIEDQIRILKETWIKAFTKKDIVMDMPKSIIPEEDNK